MAQAGVMRAAAGGLAVLVLGSTVSGCAGGSAPAPVQAKAPLPAGPIARAMAEVQSGDVPAPPPHPTIPNDTCGANALAYLIGRPRTEIPIPVNMSRRRVACTACPVAPDVRLDRLNILFDAETGKVTRLTCG